MTDPLVSFVVPCYKLAHLLPECVHSMLAQTYGRFEVLIMDDCSPDETPEVARSFGDPRIRHIRNESNLGHLHNYNKGISLARGKYVWLISADDRLRKPYVLERYVRIMERHPRAGYVFCPAVRLDDGQETNVVGHASPGGRDAVVSGHRFLIRLVNVNFVVAPCVMVRKECYEKVSLFPLDMPWGGDWYLWCVFALHYDVAYCAEPMVNYRRHALSMTDTLTNQDLRECAEEDEALPWRIKQKAEEAGCLAMVKRCRISIAHQYASGIASRKYRSSKSWHEYSLTLGQFEGSLLRNTSHRHEQNFIRARVYAGLADTYFWKREFARSLEFYEKAFQQDPWMVQVWAKYLLLRTGKAGIRFRERLPALRRTLSSMRLPGRPGYQG